MIEWSLAEHGDALERECLPLFLDSEFPSYERFWRQSVVPVTQRGLVWFRTALMSSASAQVYILSSAAVEARAEETAPALPADIGFRSDAELWAVGKCHEDICLAQLHYTVLVHLGEASGLRRAHGIGAENLTHAVVRLSAATDVADELLGRWTWRGSFKPWDERDGDRARRRWREGGRSELAGLRKSRNRLLHGRVLPLMQEDGVCCYPRFGRESRYLDWRDVTGTQGWNLVRDFATTDSLLDGAWKAVLDYLETQWRDRLLT